MFPTYCTTGLFILVSILKNNLDVDIRTMKYLNPIYSHLNFPLSSFFQFFKIPHQGR